MKFTARRDDDFEPAEIAAVDPSSVQPLQLPQRMADAVHDVQAILQNVRPTVGPHFITADPETQLLAFRAEQLAASLPMHVPVLITGAPGTGKELIARKFHRFGEPFIALNMAAMPDTLIASLLFGHKRGAFTGALESTKGAFREARSGVLFLDEIGDMPLPLQPVLLRVLQERRVTAVGDTLEEAVHCRIVAATNRNIQDPTIFRPDLCARLSMLRLRIKSLLERPCDLHEIGGALGLTKEDIELLLDNRDTKQKIADDNVRALQAFALRKQYMGDILA